jgi:hypothetical protein
MELRINPLRSAASDRLAPQQAELARLLHADSLRKKKTAGYIATKNGLKWQFSCLDVCKYEAAI